MNKFWMCYNSNKFPHNIPTKKHFSLNEAKEEAERLCRKESGQEIAILECIGSVRFKETPIEFVESKICDKFCPEMERDDNEL